MAKVRVYQLGWMNDRAQRPGEDPTSLFHSVVELDGNILEDACGVKIEAAGGDFPTVAILVNCSEIEFVRLNEEEWSDLLSPGVDA